MKPMKVKAEGNTFRKIAHASEFIKLDDELNDGETTMKVGFDKDKKYLNDSTMESYINVTKSVFSEVDGTTETSIVSGVLSTLVGLQPVEITKKSNIPKMIFGGLLIGAGAVSGLVTGGAGFSLSAWGIGLMAGGAITVGIGAYGDDFEEFIDRTRNSNNLINEYLGKLSEYDTNNDDISGIFTADANDEFKNLQTLYHKVVTVDGSALGIEEGGDQLVYVGCAMTKDNYNKPRYYYAFSSVSQGSKHYAPSITLAMYESDSFVEICVNEGDEDTHFYKDVAANNILLSYLFAGGSDNKLPFTQHVINNIDVTSDGIIKLKPDVTVEANEQYRISNITKYFAITDIHKNNPLSSDVLLNGATLSIDTFGDIIEATIDVGVIPELYRDNEVLLPLFDNRIVFKYEKIELDIAEGNDMIGNYLSLELSELNSAMFNASMETHSLLDCLGKLRDSEFILTGDYTLLDENNKAFSVANSNNNNSSEAIIKLVNDIISSFVLITSADIPVVDKNDDDKIDELERTETILTTYMNLYDSMISSASVECREFTVSTTIYFVNRARTKYYTRKDIDNGNIRDFAKATIKVGSVFNDGTAEQYYQLASITNLVKDYASILLDAEYRAIVEPNKLTTSISKNDTAFTVLQKIIYAIKRGEFTNYILFDDITKQDIEASDVKIGIMVPSFIAAKGSCGINIPEEVQYNNAEGKSSIVVDNTVWGGQSYRNKFITVSQLLNELNTTQKYDIIYLWNQHLCENIATYGGNGYYPDLTSLEMSFRSLSYNKDFSGVSIYSNIEDDVIEIIDSLAKESMGLTGLTHTNTLRNCNSIVRYLVAQSVYNVSNQYLDSILLDGMYMGKLIDKEKITYVGILPKVMRNLDSSDRFPDNTKSYAGYLLGSTHKYLEDDSLNTYRGLLINVLSNIEHGLATYQFSELGQDAGYTLADIWKFFGLESNTVDDSTIFRQLGIDEEVVKAEESDISNEILKWMQENQYSSGWEQSEGVTQLSDESQDFAINLYRTIIELYDMCTFLGIYVDEETGQITPEELGVSLNNDTVSLLPTFDKSKDEDWSSIVRAYLIMYVARQDFFELLRNNNQIYERSQEGHRSEANPMGQFFSVQDKTLTDQWIKGFSLSSLYVPMETNLYDYNSISFLADDSDWISEFYYKYAFYRKALYINTDNSAIVNEFVSGEKSGTRVATLSDLLNYERDIVLTVDDNFYNANEIDKIISALDYTNLRGNVEESSEGMLDSLGDWISEISNLSADRILKTGSNNYYLDILAQNATQLGSQPTYKNSFMDAYLLPAKDILGDSENGVVSVLDDYEYSVKQSYGVVSAIYRSASLYNQCLSALVSDNAIFKSSSAICATPGTSSSNWRSIYNYMMLANLEEQMKNDAASTLDLNAPIFCDLFGNIVTESGLVIIPAACNATLCGTTWSPYTVGWSEYYNNGNKIKTGVYTDTFYSWLIGRSYQSHQEYNGTNISSKEPSKANAGGYFEVTRSGELELRPTQLVSNNLSAVVDWSMVNKNAEYIRQLFFSDAYFNKGRLLYGARTTNMIIEVLRGAPIENIDYLKEGLEGNKNISKYGIYMAYKLEEISDFLVGGNGIGLWKGNTMVTMPNLAFVEGLEFIILYAYKIAFAIAIVGFVVSLYINATRNRISLMTLLSMVGTVMGVVVAITLMPKVISWTYYDANKTLLKEEAGYISMFNYVKRFDGAEIDITEVTTPDTNTELYIKVGDIQVDWWDYFDDILLKSTFTTVDEIYEDAVNSNALAKESQVIRKGENLYIDIQDIYDSTEIVYIPEVIMLENRAYKYGNYENTVDTVSSYILPYYVILDQLITSINEYNALNVVESYSYSIGSNGHIMTYDVIAPYFNSERFHGDGWDTLGLFHNILNDYTAPITTPNITERDKEAMRRSLWFPNEDMPEELIRENLNYLNAYAKEYVAKNLDLIGKVPDEVFLKCMAMQIAIEYNKLFNIPQGNSIEVVNVDTRDMLRFMVSNREQVYKYYSYGFARFVYEQSNALGVVVAALLVLVLYLTGFIKPVLMLIITALLVINVLLRKMLFQKTSRCIEGYLIATACLVLCNYSYAGMLKLTMLVAQYTNNPITSMLMGLVVQIAYVLCLVGIACIEIKDWQNSGYSEFATTGSKFISGIVHAEQVVANKFASMANENFKNARANHSRLSHSNEEYDMSSVDRMLERDNERESAYLR